MTRLLTDLHLQHDYQELDEDLWGEKSCVFYHLRDLSLAQNLLKVVLRPRHCE